MQVTGKHKRWRFRAGAERGQSGSGGGVGSAGETFSRRLGVHPVVATLMRQRGIDGSEAADRFLQPRLVDLHDPLLLPGAQRAAQRLDKATRNGESIVIYGDYDVDGVTASAILWHVLKLAGARVEVFVPHRIDDGYGLNSRAVEALAAKHQVIVTVDCGITAVEPASIARQAGVDLIITDHHEMLIDQDLPDAHALVHPRLSELEKETKYPFGYLCGAGVAYKLAWQFAKLHCGSDRVSEAFRGLLLDLLSYVALGTIADVVPLIDENRVLTRFGLNRIKNTRFVGLNALIDAAGLRGDTIDADHVGFVLGPRLNACGRMGHAAKAVHLLTAAEAGESSEIATFLTRENERRRRTERVIYEEAKQMAIDRGYDAPDCRAIVLGKEGWHPGVIGIVASRLVETFARPVVLLNYDNGQAQGSARSVAGVSIHDAFEHCAPLLKTYGGHARAAGLKLETRHIDELRDQLVAFVNDRLSVDDLVSEISIDAQCSLDEVEVPIFEQIQRLAPFGSENPRPTLCLMNTVLDRPAQRIGRQGDHLKLILRQGQRLASAVAFRMGDWAGDLPAGLGVDVAFEPKISTWQGRRRAEIHVKDLRPLPA